MAFFESVADNAADGGAPAGNASTGAAPTILAPDWLTVPADVNELADGIWPCTARRGSACGILTVAELRVTDLVAEYGSPLYVIDEAAARGRAIRLREAFETEFARIGTKVNVYYAGKAFLCTEVVRWMIGAGLNIDVCTGGELAVALAGGAPPARIGFHGNNKSVAEIDRAVAAGVGTIVLDSLAEIDRVADAAAAHGVTQRVRLRVNSGVHAHTHEHLATAHDDQKFGISLAGAPAAVATIRARAELEFLGLHCHIGSQIFGADGFAVSAEKLLEVHADLLRSGPVPELNLGGGFGIAYTTADRPDSIEQIAGQVADAVAAGCARLDIEVPAISFEPGRWIIGPPGITCYEVGTVKPVPVDDGVRTYVSVDGGMSDNARPALYGADYTATVANRRSTAGPALSRVAGKHCETGDLIVNDGYLPGDVRPGDLLAVAATGAYCWSLASNYNYVGRPAVIAVADGRARVIVRGETEHDVLARDPGISP